MPSYLTIQAPSEAKYTEKMSKFYAFAFPVASGVEAKERVGMIANQYHDARHVCWAYMVGADRKDFLCNDNGEPSGTAGKPILGQINSFNLTDVVVIVVRYFGGIKLGTSGLIAAYREAAREALENASVIERHVMASLTFNFPYLAMNDVMRLIKNSDAEILSQQFDNSCQMTLRVKLDEVEALKTRLVDIDGVTLN